MIKEIIPPEAWEIMQNDPGSVILDVRSKVEFDYVGHPIDAIHVPWKEAPGWQIDPQFVSHVRDTLKNVYPEKNPEELNILAICRSGARSHSAAQALITAGFKKVANIQEGFEGDRDENNHRGNINGWRYHKLPWEQT